MSKEKDKDSNRLRDSLIDAGKGGPDPLKPSSGAQASRKVGEHGDSSHADHMDHEMHIDDTHDDYFVDDIHIDRPHGDHDDNGEHIDYGTG
jgi:hypothetical protein